MISMDMTRNVVAVALFAGAGLAMNLAQAQLGGLGRTDVLKPHDLSVAGREVSQVRVNFGPGAAAPKHSHPGEEIAYVLDGTLEYQLEGQAPVTLKTGDSILIPAGTNHTAKNVGSGHAVELATYLVEKGKPLVVLAK
jgi:quercetin dioxygenase-like cupin family protein